MQFSSYQKICQSLFYILPIYQLVVHTCLSVLLNYSSVLTIVLYILTSYSLVLIGYLSVDLCLQIISQIFVTKFQTANLVLVPYSFVLALVFSILANYSSVLVIYHYQDILANYPSPFAKRTNQPCNPNFAKKLVQFTHAQAIFQIAKRWHCVSVRHMSLLLVIVCFCQLFFQTVQGAQVITAPLPNTCRHQSICKYCPFGKVIYFSLQMRSNICIFI